MSPSSPSNPPPLSEILNPVTLAAEYVARKVPCDRCGKRPVQSFRWRGRFLGFQGRCEAHPFEGEEGGEGCEPDSSA